MRPALLFALAAVAGCSSTPEPPPPATCDATCADSVVLYALRQTMAFVYNQSITGQPPGSQDGGGQCLTGSASVGGTAVPDAGVGSVGISLAYRFDACEALRWDDAPARTYALVLTGAVSEEGTLAVQSTSTMTLTFKSDALSISGTVYAPPADFSASACVLDVTQNGNVLDGTICGRKASASY